MVLIPISITYNGQDQTVEFEDSLTFGETEALISGSVDLGWRHSKASRRRQIHLRNLLRLCKPIWLVKGRSRQAADRIS